MNLVLEKYKGIVPKSDNELTDKMLAKLIQISVQDQQRMWFRDEFAGDVCVYHSNEFPGTILEYVKGEKDDSVTTIYEGNNIFMDLPRLVDARQHIIAEIGAATMAIPSSITVFDDGREREAFLRELGTAQLLDVLAHIKGTRL